MRVPPLLHTTDEVEEKLELLQALDGIEVAVDILKTDTASTQSALDQRYKQLECDLEPLERTSMFSREPTGGGVLLDSPSTDMVVDVSNEFGGGRSVDQYTECGSGVSIFEDFNSSGLESQKGHDTQKG
ncbi:hypothetical protein PHET_10355 [Paragonimus heterotremus]|uniref:NAD(+) ADP-ribosyltransferase n=1 Tax=Paragonimus heterotremus TaxID=100268 RepID=A0A8J4T8I2_9TREM|nr:hypothetical protein PHET_10355 [Paragonimus heterotremus]